MPVKNMFVYVMANKNKTHPTLYASVTNNLTRRIQEHKKGAIKRFTQRYNLHKLIYYETIEGQEQAIIKKKQIKNMSREEKLQMIKEINSPFKDLYYQLGKTIY